MFYSKFVQLCLEHNVSPSKAAADCGLKSAHVYKWKNGSKPTDITKLKIANHFGVDVSYFNEADEDEVAMKEEKQKEKAPTISGGSSKAELINLIMSIPEDGVDRLLEIAKVLYPEV